jgi:hypothetical protein
MHIEDMFRLTISLGMPLLIGWGIVESFFTGKTRFFFLEKVFLAFGLGFGWITLCMLYLSILRITFNPAAISFWSLCVILLIAFYRKTHRGKIATDGAGSAELPPDYGTIVTPLCIFLLLFVLANLIAVCFETMAITYDIWDSWDLWAFKAKIFFHHKIIPLPLFQKFNTAYGHWDYPQHVPLMEAWILLWLGNWNDQLPRIIFPVFYTGLCGMFFCFLRRYTSLKAALAGVFFLATFRNLQISTIGTITEPVLLFYYLTGFLLLYRWMGQQDNRLLILSALFSGLACWTKNEGLVLFINNALVLALFLLFEKAKKKELSYNLLWQYIIIGLSIALPWFLLRGVLGLENDIINHKYLRFDYLRGRLYLFTYTWEALKFHFFNFKLWNITWIMAFLFFIYSLFRPPRDKSGYVLFSIFFQCAVYLFIFAIYPDPKEYLYLTMMRLMLSPAVLAILFCGLMF